MDFSKNCLETEDYIVIEEIETVKKNILNYI